jgi:cysteine desulfurase family protein (TIGR01976 family)
VFDVTSLRHQFPALQTLSDGRPPVFFDGPAGTQVPRRVIDAVTDYLARCNANQGGAFATSVESDRVLRRAHEGMADLLNAPSPDEIVFGPNMTTLAFHFTRAVARTLRPGDEILVTRLDHDANVTPWVLAARDAGAAVQKVDVRPEDCTLDTDDLRRKLGPRTRWLALPAASNAVGTRTDVTLAARWAHEAGARVFVDAVHFAPHGPIDVQAWGCDALACSAYKFFGPHVGVLWAKQDLLEALPAYKVRPAPEALPGRWMTGTQNHEGLAGLAAAVDYLAELGAHQVLPPGAAPSLSGRRLQLRAAMTAIQAYEKTLSRTLLEGLGRRPRFRVWGITDLERLAERVPTVSVTVPDRAAGRLAEHLAARHIHVWSGSLYAVELVERLGLADRGGLLRIGLVHYNTAEEIERLLEALDALPPE